MARENEKTQKEREKQMETMQLNTRISKAATRIPRGEFRISIEELRRQVSQGRVGVGNQGLAPTSTAADIATKVPKGTFHITIEELRRQVSQGRVGAGSQGLTPASSSSGSATKVPKGTFCARHIREFEHAAPNARYVGEDPRLGPMWMETVADAVTGVPITLAYTTNNGGRTAEAWCIDPDMNGHSEDLHACHCYGDGRVCTDLVGVRRTLAEKRARAILWVSGFVNYLREGRFRLDDAY